MKPGVWKGITDHVRQFSGDRAAGGVLAAVWISQVREVATQFLGSNKVESSTMLTLTVASKLTAAANAWYQHQYSTVWGNSSPAFAEFAQKLLERFPAPPEEQLGQLFEQLQQGSKPLTDYCNAVLELDSRVPDTILSQAMKVAKVLAGLQQDQLRRDMQLQLAAGTVHRTVVAVTQFLAQLQAGGLCKSADKPLVKPKYGWPRHKSKQPMGGTSGGGLHHLGRQLPGEPDYKGCRTCGSKEHLAKDCQKGSRQRQQGQGEGQRPARG